MDSQETNHLSKLLDHTVLGGKLGRSQLLLETSLTQTGKNDDDISAAIASAWALEFMQAHFLVEDDIMDHGSIRRGKPCWYKVPGIGTPCAINDGLILLSCVYEILSEFVSSHPAYPQILKLFLETQHNTSLGQLLDLRSQLQQQTEYSDGMNQELPLYSPMVAVGSSRRYLRLAECKTAHYSFVLPLSAGLLLSLKDQESSHMNSLLDLPLVRSIGIELGICFQIQDDILDCFADENRTGKCGSDIQEGKCTWLSSAFWQNPTVTSVMRELFQRNYGSSEDACVQQVKKLYKSINLQKAAKQDLEERHQKIQQLTKQLKRKELCDIIDRLWNRMANRNS